METIIRREQEDEQRCSMEKKSLERSWLPFPMCLIEKKGKQQQQQPAAATTTEWQRTPPQPQPQQR